MQLITATDAARLGEIKKLYKTAFPRSERKPFFLICKKQKEGWVEILSIESDDGEFLGLAILVFQGDLALLDYFAIAPEKRGGGIGGEAFELLKARCKDKRFFLEIEDVRAESANAEERQRRRAFYLRHQMTPLPFFVGLFGVEMELLCAAAPLTFDEYRGLYRTVFGRFIASKIRRL